MKSEFHSQGFTIYHNTSERDSITDLMDKDCSCGIYILHFENNEYYAGQSINIAKRFIDHSKKHIDISFISIKPTPKEDLNVVEIEAIKLLEEQNKTLRNINLVSLLKGETEIDKIIDKETIEKWKQYALPKESLLGSRFDYPALRNKYTKRFSAFSVSSYYEVIIRALQDYILFTIPLPRKTEYSFWSISCLPSGPSNLLVRVNLYWQETLCIYEETWKYEGKNIRELYVSVFMCKSVLLSKTTEQSLREKYPSLEFTILLYKTGGQDQINAQLSIFDFEEFIYERVVSDAIKEFNWRLMKKGGCNNNRYHCFHLADAILEDEEALSNFE